MDSVKPFGLVAIASSAGGITALSEWFGMPRSALETGSVDYVLPLEQIGAKLVELLGNGAKAERKSSGRSRV
ncbi:MAG TPA: hypothetical protein VH700_02455 [Gemmatimonadales bacterium]|jgi:chemotaxis response regulator CheB|nr:hypothetical protein [Gemmatimonadales bacterium]